MRYLRARYILMLCIIPLYWIFLPSCSQNTNTLDAINIAINASNDNIFYIDDTEEKSHQGPTIIDIKNDVQDGDTLGCITSSGTYIYYEICKIGVTNYENVNYLKSTIFRVDTNSKETQKIVEITNNDNPFFTNELTCVGESLFWVLRANDEVKIVQYNLNSGKQAILKTYPMYDSALVLTGDNQFLLWYETDNNIVSLWCYDTYSEEIICISSNVTNDSAYTRAYVNNGITAYLEEAEKGRKLVVYNLGLKAPEYIGIVPAEFEQTRLQANSEYVICTDGYHRDSSIYVLESGKQEFKKITLPDVDYNIFSCFLYENYILINANRFDKILVVQLDSKSYYSIDLKDINSIIQARISPFGIFYASSPRENKLIALNISQGV